MTIWMLMLTLYAALNLSVGLLLLRRCWQERGSSDYYHDS